MTAREKVTAEQFFGLPETNHIVELVDGEIIMSATPVTHHQRIILRTARHLEDIMPDGEVFIAPLSVYLDDLNIPEPDVYWVSAANQSVVHEKHIFGVPDLIVEIFSPSTEKRDRKDKFELYERYGVREYWMIDPEPELLEVWVHENQRFTRLGIYTPGETFASPTLGSKTVEVSRLFSR
jgi:Uma2 family endonuclease